MLDLLIRLGAIQAHDAEKASRRYDESREGSLAEFLIAGSYLSGLPPVGDPALATLTHAETQLLDEIRQALALGPTIGGLSATLQEAALDPGSLAVGKLLGNYRILGLIAEGGMGGVYRVRSVHLDRILALKVILGGELATPDQVARFKREAQSTARLHHPNIVTLHDFGFDQGHYYFTMDYVEGPTLAELLLDGPMEERQAVALICQVAEAVDYAHLNGILHRDIKPGNILMRDDRPLITDFGLATQGVDQADVRLTRTGAPMGTPAYMPPEQARGQRDKQDARSDVYSLGAVFYEMLCGQPPFRGQSAMEIIAQVIGSDPIRLSRVASGVDRELEAVALKAMARESSQRYASARELVEDLQAWQEGRETLARPLGILGRVLKAYARNRIACLTAFLLLLLGGFYVVSLRRALGNAREARDEARHQRALTETAMTRAREQRQTIELQVAELKRRDRQSTARETARLARRETDVERGIALFEQAVSVAPRRFEILVMLGAYLKQHGHFVPAIRAYEKAHLAGLAERVTAQLLAPMLLDHYWCYVRRDPLTWQVNDLRAKAVLVALRQLAPDSPLSLFAAANQARQKQQSIRLLSRAIALSKRTFWQAHAFRGMLLIDLGRNMDALKDFDTAARVVPENPWVLQFRGWVRLAAMRPADAFRDFNQAAKLERNRNEITLLGRGFSGTLLGRYDLAEQDMLYAGKYPHTIYKVMRYRLLRYPLVCQTAAMVITGHINKQPQRGYLYGLRGLFYMFLAEGSKGDVRRQHRSRALRDLERLATLTPKLRKSSSYFIRLLRKTK